MKMLIVATCTLLATLAYAQPASQPARIDAADHPSLQAALDALPRSGGVVFVPPGDHEIAEPLVLSTPETRLEGAGSSSHIINRNADGKPALIIQPATYAEDAKARMWRVQIGNLRLSGNPDSGEGLLAQGIQEIFIHGLSIDHHGGHGINLVDCYEDPRISDSILTYNAKAGLNILRGHDIVVNGNQFEENQDAVRCIDSFNLCMNGNNLDDHLRHGVVIENTYGSVVSGNMIEECAGTGIILDRDCYGITLSANVIAHEMGGGIDLRDAWGCAVSANTFTIVHDFSIAVRKNSGRIAISGNAFGNSYQGEDAKLARSTDPDEPRHRQDVGTGVLLEETQNVNISGNTFTGMSGLAVEARGACKRLLIANNLMADLHRSGETSKSPYHLPDARHVMIVNNLGDGQ